METTVVNNNLHYSFRARNYTNLAKTLFFLLLIINSAFFSPALLVSLFATARNTNRSQRKVLDVNDPTSPFRINYNIQGDQENMQPGHGVSIALFKNNDIAFSWYNHNLSSSATLANEGFISIFTSNGITISGDLPLDTSFSGPQYYTDLAPTISGNNVRAVWAQYAPNYANAYLQTRLFNNLGAPVGASSAVDSSTPNYFQNSPAISTQNQATDETQAFNIAWTKYTAGYSQINAKFGLTPPIIPLNTTGNNQDFSRIVTLANGNLITTWVNGDIPQVVAEMTNNTSSFESPFIVFENTTVVSSAPSIIKSPDGFIIAAQFNSGNATRIGFRSFDNQTNPLMATIRVQDVGLMQQYARLAATQNANSENIIGVFYDQQSNASGLDIWQQWFYFNGTTLPGLLGQPYLANSAFVANDQSCGEVKVLSDGRVLVVYHSYNQASANSGWDIYGQFFTTGPRLINSQSVTNYTQVGSPVLLNVYLARPYYYVDVNNVITFNAEFILSPTNAGILLNSSNATGVAVSYNPLTGVLNLNAGGSNALTHVNNYLNGLSFVPSSDITATLQNVTITYNVYDAVGIPLSENGIIQLQGMPIEHAAVITVNNWPIGQGQTRVVTSNNLNMLLDYTSSPDTTVISVTDLSSIAFLANASPVTSFTLTQLRTGQIQIRHDGSTTYPNFLFTVTETDGAASNPIAAVISFDLAPSLINNRLSVSNLGVTAITPAQISATDSDSSLSTLLFIPSQVQDGYFILADQQVSNFTQANVSAGLVAFNVTGVNPFWWMSVNDGEVITTAQPVQITNTIPGATQSPTTTATTPPPLINTPTPSSVTSTTLSTTQILSIVGPIIGVASTLLGFGLYKYRKNSERKKQETGQLKHYVAEDKFASLLLKALQKSKIIQIDASVHFSAEFKDWVNNKIKPWFNAGLRAKNIIDVTIDVINQYELENILANFVNEIIKDRLGQHNYSAIASMLHIATRPIKLADLVKNEVEIERVTKYAIQEALQNYIPGVVEQALAMQAARTNFNDSESPSNIRMMQLGLFS